MSTDAKHVPAEARPRKSAWQRGRFLAFLAVVSALLIVLHEHIPNRWVGLGSLVQTFAPWLGLAVPILIVLSLVRRSATAVLFVLLPLAAWLWQFGPQLLPEDRVTYDLVVVQHNLSDENADVAGTLADLLAEDPDLIALEEVTPELLPEVEAALTTAYPHHAVQGTVGLWSRLPLAEATPVDLRPAGVDASWDRGLRVVAQAPQGPVAVYVAHLPSARVGLRGLDAGARNASIGLLAAALAAEPVGTVVLAGDLNSELRDRALDPVLEHVGGSVHGFDLTFPARFPVVRVDQVLTREAEVVRTWTLGPTGSDHRPVVAYVSLPDPA
ncbi:endonuclease/exonuclease/phosphatase family protein [Antribacter gilvus]|uniref:endonuclease/exonuclease/phosphatase family protein n=1 Tax=Antribacter gilvus TaxID=2304675 RepID=UPI000F77C3DE|nr:endonuclease/exonuclease/phosphatase family protein [Antribacter gilvus]